MTGSIVKWGILSTADINRKVIPGAHASGKVDLVAVASRDQARADAYARTWEIPRAYGTYEALLADPEIEAVYISLPTASSSSRFASAVPQSNVASTSCSSCSTPAVTQSVPVGPMRRSARASTGSPPSRREALTQ